ncbi:MAG: hypothetical protein GY870_04965 [archaeon]|nr:hypothetical protein [archaeon]
MNFLKLSNGVPKEKMDCNFVLRSTGYEKFYYAKGTDTSKPFTGLSQIKKNHFIEEVFLCYKHKFYWEGSEQKMFFRCTRREQYYHDADKVVVKYPSMKTGYIDPFGDIAWDCDENTRGKNN